MCGMFQTLYILIILYSYKYNYFDLIKKLNDGSNIKDMITNIISWSYDGFIKAPFTLLIVNITRITERNYILDELFINPTLTKDRYMEVFDSFGGTLKKIIYPKIEKFISNIIINDAYKINYNLMI